MRGLTLPKSLYPGSPSRHSPIPISHMCTVKKALMTFHSISIMRDLSGSKLVQTYVKKALGMVYMLPAASSSELTGNVTLLACSDRGLMKRKNDCIEHLGLKRPLWVQTWRRQVANGYMGCCVWDILSTNLLVA